MVKLIKHLTMIQVVTIILSHVITQSEAGIAGLIASAALMAMFRPKVIPVPIPVPLPVPVPIKGKSPLNIFGSHSTEQSTPTNFPNFSNFPNHSYFPYYHHQHQPHPPLSHPMISPLALPYLHSGYGHPPYPHLYPPMAHPLIPPSPLPNVSPFSSAHGPHLMTTSPLTHKLYLPYGALPHPTSAYHQHHPIHQNVYRPSPLTDYHSMYPPSPSPYYSGPFVFYI